MSDHIHYLHNKSDYKITVEKVDRSSGQYHKKDDIPPGAKAGSYENIDITDLRIVVNKKNKKPIKKPVYFKVIPGLHTPGNKPHKDGEVGHPQGDER